jgi:predicted XRE-type DNA-binding protein
MSVNAKHSHTVWSKEMRNTNSENETFTKSSGNVFLDLGFPPDEAANLLLRSTFMARLTRIVDDKALTQAQAAKLFGITQPRVNLLLKGKIGEFSLDALVNMLARAGFVIEPKIVKRRSAPVPA